jgi:hypothetical protein
MIRVRTFLMSVLLPAALAAQQPPRPVAPQQVWRLDTGG